jgi:hypothetical protein
VTSAAVVGPTAALRRAAVRATLAPSVDNSQPWSLRLHDEQLDLYADVGRQQPVRDPRGRRLTISCGAALMNARVSLTAGGFDVRVDRFPDRRNHELLARLTVLGGPHPQVHSRVSLASPAALRTLDQFVDARHTNHDLFTDDEVPTAVLDVLARAVADEHGDLFVVRSAQQRAALASVSASADAAGSVADDRCVVVLGSGGDDALDWLRTGEALERMLLEATRQGIVAGPWSQRIVSAADRESLRAGLGLTMTPQVVLPIGHAPVGPGSRRRRLVDVLVEDG